MLFVLLKLLFNMTQTKNQIIGTKYHYVDLHLNAIIIKSLTDSNFDLNNILTSDQIIIIGNNLKNRLLVNCNINITLK